MVYAFGISVMQVAKVGKGEYKLFLTTVDKTTVPGKKTCIHSKNVACYCGVLQKVSGKCKFTEENNKV